MKVIPYKLVDYYTGKQVTTKLYDTEADAYHAKQAYLSMKIREKEVHNNLILIRKAII